MRLKPAIPLREQRYEEDDARTELPPSYEGFSVELAPEPTSYESPDGMMTNYNADGGMSISFGGVQPIDAPSPFMDEFKRNIAGEIDETERAIIANDLCDAIEADRMSNKPFIDRYTKGLKLLGLDAPETSAQNLEMKDVNHPLIAEAAIQLNARAMAELLPPTGKYCQSQIIGEESEEVREAADRVEDHMNYQMTEEDTGYRDEIDLLTFNLGLTGDEYTKTYYDRLTDCVVTRRIRPDNLVMPYVGSGLRSSPRYTILERITEKELKKRVQAGIYIDTNASAPLSEVDQTDIEQKLDKIDGKEDRRSDSDGRILIGECYCYRTIAGFEDAVETEYGELEPTGIELPYVITVDMTNKAVLAVQQNWREQDPDKRMRHYVVQRKCLPGTGSRGMGWIHLIGGLAQGCTDAMQLILETAYNASQPGGFITREGSKVQRGAVRYVAGEFQDTDASYEELSKSFWQPNLRDPSPALMQSFAHMEEIGRRLLSTTDAVVGDGTNAGPVGTTVALIEQATKVTTGIITRLHHAQREEYGIRAELNAEYLPENKEYKLAGRQQSISRNDYALGLVKILPVSDPNISSAAQRISQAQALLQLAQGDPEFFSKHRYNIYSRFLKTIKIDDIDDYITDPDKRHRCDAWGEGARLMAGDTIHAFPDQDHAAHMALHAVQIEYFKTLPKERSEPLLMMLSDHMAKHEAYQMHNRMNQLMGGTLPELDLYDDDEESDMSPEVERAVTQQTSVFVPKLMQDIQAMQPPPAEDMEAKAKMQREDAAFRQKMQQNEAEFQQDMEHKDIEFKAGEMKKALL